MKYRHNLADALNKVSFEVQPAEKVGIVGRTGSGKSSLFLALFRMVEIYKGNIFVDGINLIHLDLKDIRFVVRNFTLLNDTNEKRTVLLSNYDYKKQLVD